MKKWNKDEPGVGGGQRKANLMSSSLRRWRVYKKVMTRPRLSPAAGRGVLRCERTWRKRTEGKTSLQSQQEGTESGWRGCLAGEVGRWGATAKRRVRSGTGTEGWGYHRTKSSSFQRVSGQRKQWRFRGKKVEQGKEESWGRTDEMVSIIFAPSSGRRGFTGGPKRKLLEKRL